MLLVFAKATSWAVLAVKSLHRAATSCAAQWILFTASTVLLCYSSLHTVAKATVASLSSVLQGLLLSAYLKMLLADPNDAQLRQQVSAVYERYSHFMDADLQQRAVEYQGLMKLPDVASRNVTAMPKWEKRKSLLLRRMAEKEVGLVDHVLQSWPAAAAYG